MHWIRGVIGVAALLAILVPQAVPAAGPDGGDELLVQYIEFPPYYFTGRNGHPEGILVELTREVLDRAGVRVTGWESRPAKRVLSNMYSERPILSMGWFRTPERERYARFSSVLYENKQLRALFLKKFSPFFAGKTTLAGLLADRSLRPGFLEGYSLGPTADALIAEAKPDAVLVVGGYGRLIGMLAEERFFYIVLPPMTIRPLIRLTHLNPAIFESIPLADVVGGDKRYFMYSRGVPDRLIRRIDQALKAVRKE